MGRSSRSRRPGRIVVMVAKLCRRPATRRVDIYATTSDPFPIFESVLALQAQTRVDELGTTYRTSINSSSRPNRDRWRCFWELWLSSALLRRSSHRKPAWPLPGTCRELIVSLAFTVRDNLGARGFIDEDISDNLRSAAPSRLTGLFICLTVITAVHARVSSNGRAERSGASEGPTIYER